MMILGIKKMQNLLCSFFYFVFKGKKHCHRDWIFLMPDTTCFSYCVIVILIEVVV